MPMLFHGYARLSSAENPKKLTSAWAIVKEIIGKYTRGAPREKRRQGSDFRGFGGELIHFVISNEVRNLGFPAC